MDNPVDLAPNIIGAAREPGTIRARPPVPSLVDALAIGDHFLLKAGQDPALKRDDRDQFEPD